MNSTEPRQFDSEADETIDFLFRKGFGTCRANSGEYSVVFRFQSLREAQEAYRKLVNAYVKKMET